MKKISNARSSQQTVLVPLSITIQSIQNTIRYSETLHDTDVDFIRKLRNIMYRAQEDRRNKCKQVKITDYCKEI